MGSGASHQRLGERVLTAQEKLASDMKIQAERAEKLKEASPETLEVMVQSVANSFERCSPFSDATLLVAFHANPVEVERVLTKSVKKVMSAPIRKDEYQWFMVCVCFALGSEPVIVSQQYVFPSSIWMMKTQQNEFMFELMMTITKSMSEKIDNSMHSIFKHLGSHQEWDSLLAIKNQTVVPRQDDDKVGLLMEKGIREMAELKSGDDADSDDLVTFVDSNVAVNILTATANKINTEFQSHLRSVMNRFGDFKAGPTKGVERCQSKLENDYPDAEYPKAARLLDVVRCAVSFNTVEQLLAGYKWFPKDYCSITRTEESGYPLYRRRSPKNVCMIGCSSQRCSDLCTFCACRYTNTF